LDINSINTKLVPVRFEYFRPKTEEEALLLLDRFGRNAAVIAGGTDLLVKVKQRSQEPRAVISIRGLASLSYIEEGSKALRVGAATRMVDIEQSAAVASRFPMLREAASIVGSIQIRHMATIGGNLCNASPAADGSVALLALDSELKLASARGRRSVPITKFFTAPGRTVMDEREILTEVVIPFLPPGSGTAFARITRTEMDLAKVNVAVALTLKDRQIAGAKIALGAVAPTPIRAYRAEKLLAGQEPSDALLWKAAEEAAAEVKPITDVRSTAEYRRDVTAVLVRRSLLLARSRAGGASND